MPQNGRSARRRRAPPGTPPGTLVVPSHAQQTKVEIFGYGPDTMEHMEGGDGAVIDRMAAGFPNLWINIEGLANLELIRSVGARFGLHELALEDVLNTHQRAKTEEYPDHSFIIARMPMTRDFPRTEQVALFVGRTFVISIQERKGDCFDPIRTRLRDPRGRIRANGPDFLAYALLDAIVDSYFPVLERIGEDLDRLESDALVSSSGDIMRRIHQTKREVIDIRRAVWPHRDMIAAILRDDSPFFTDRTRIFLRDCQDHVAQLIEIVETDREFVSDLFEVHLSRVNLRMNEIMKVLTVIATVFIPLSFIASLYGMNFSTSASPWNMPELTWRYGYLFALGAMIAVAAGLLFFLYRRGWLNSSPRDGNPRRRN